MVYGECNDEGIFVVKESDFTGFHILTHELQRSGLSLPYMYRKQERRYLKIFSARNVTWAAVHGQSSKPLTVYAPLQNEGLERQLDMHRYGGGKESLFVLDAVRHYNLMWIQSHPAEVTNLSHSTTATWPLQHVLISCHNWVNTLRKCASISRCKWLMSLVSTCIDTGGEGEKHSFRLSSLSI